MSQWPFSSNFRRFKPHSRSSLFRDGSPDTDDMFFEPSSSWNLPNMSRFGSVFDSSPLRSNMRPSFLSHHFESEPFFRNAGWMDDEMRHSRADSPLDPRRSPTPPRAANSSRGSSASPGTANQPFFGRHDNGRVPVKVRHETSRSNTPSSSSNDGDNRSDHGAPESPAPAPGVEKHAGVKAKVNSTSTKYPQQAQRQPKVHHIPIRVEPREDSNNQGRDQTTSSRDYATATPMSSRDDGVTSNKNASENEKKRTARGEKTNGGRSTVRIIPVQVNENKDKKTEDSQASSIQEENIPPPPPPPPPSSSGKPNSVELIESTLRDLEKLKKRVNKFSGTRSEKEYLYLDEMLTRHLIRLDNIMVEGDNELRQTRRAAIKQVNSCIHLLESKVVTSRDEEENLDLNENEKIEAEMSTETVNVALSESGPVGNRGGEEMVVDNDTHGDEKEESRKSEDKELGEEPGKMFTSTVEMQITDDAAGKDDASSVKNLED